MMPVRRPTIHDVAARAGVSKSTVSLVLQASPRVRSETAKAVRAAMADMGYVYNRTAAKLRTASAGLVGLVINDLRNPFFTEFAASFQMSLAARGYATVISNSAEDAALQARLVGSMIEHGVSAIVISPAYGDAPDTFDLLARAKVPALQVLRRADDRLDLFPFAGFDDATGSAVATEHLLAAGAKRIAFVGGPPDRAIVRERMAGYLARLEAAGLPPVHVPGPATRAFGAVAARLVSEETPAIDAAICFNDLVALGVMAGCARLGRQVGRDLRLVGFDYIEDCALVWPQLSSVACDIAGFARETADRLLTWMAENRRPPPVIRVPVSLVVRHSSAGVGTRC